jgi:hypothetical protein
MQGSGRVNGHRVFPIDGGHGVNKDQGVVNTGSKFFIGGAAVPTYRHDPYKVNVLLLPSYEEHMTAHPGTTVSTQDGRQDTYFQQQFSSTSAEVHATSNQEQQYFHPDTLLAQHEGQETYFQQQQFPQTSTEANALGIQHEERRQYFSSQTLQKHERTEQNGDYRRPDDLLREFYASVDNSSFTAYTIRSLAVRAMSAHDGDTAILILQKLIDAKIKLDKGTVNSAIASCRRTEQFYHVYALKKIIDTNFQQGFSSDRKLTKEWDQFCYNARKNGYLID